MRTARLLTMSRSIPCICPTPWMQTPPLADTTLRQTPSPCEQNYTHQGSYFSGLTKFHDFSMIFPVSSVNFQVFFHYF